MNSKLVFSSCFLLLSLLEEAQLTSILSFHDKDLNVKIQFPFTITEEVPENCHNLPSPLKRDSYSAPISSSPYSSVVAVNCLQVWESVDCSGRSQRIRSGRLGTRSPEQINKVPFEIRSFQLCSGGRLRAVENATVTKSVNEVGLELHNKFRRIHGAVDLKIEEENTSIRFKGFDMEDKYGENEAYIDSASNELEAVSMAIELWYGENSFYDYGNPGYNDETRHFTQLVWKGTEEFAMAVFRFESEDPNWNTYFVMARYNPRGNLDGLYAENVMPPSNNSTIFNGSHD